MKSRNLTLSGAFVVLVVLTAALAGAGEARVERSSKAQAASATSVTLAGWASSPEETAALRRTITTFERANRDVDVKYTPISGDYDAAMLTRFAAKRPPDVFYVDSLDVPDYLPALEPLNDEIKGTKNFTTKPYFRRLLAAFTVKGQVYGLPKDWSPLGLVANREMLAKAGVSAPPTTWAQFTQMLQRLRTSDAVPDGAPACLSLDWARILAFIYQNNGAWLNPAKTQSVIDSAQNNATLNIYFSWLKSGMAKTPQQLGVGWCGEALGKQKAAVIFEGNWVYGFMQKDFPSVAFRVYPMIRNKARGNLSFTVSYSIGKASKNKAAAWRLLRFLAGRNGQSVWSKNSGFLPSRSDVKAPPGRTAFVQEAPAARPWQFIKGFDRVNDLAGKELEKAFEGDQSIADMLRAIDRATEDAIRRNS
jgi:multiple sugar transport system substrate-binding protein